MSIPSVTDEMIKAVHQAVLLVNFDRETLRHAKRAIHVLQAVQKDAKKRADEEHQQLGEDAIALLADMGYGVLSSDTPDYPRLHAVLDRIYDEEEASST